MSFIRGKHIIAFAVLYLAMPAPSVHALNRGPAMAIASTAQKVADDTSISVSERLKMLEKYRLQMAAEKSSEELKDNVDWRELNDLIRGLKLAQDHAEIQKFSDTMQGINKLVQQAGVNPEQYSAAFVNAKEGRDAAVKALADDSSGPYDRVETGMNRAPASADQARTTRN